MNSNPKQPRDDCPEETGTAANRSVRMPFRSGCERHHQSNFTRIIAPGEISGWRTPDSNAVESRPELLQQFRLPHQRRCFVRAFLQFDPNHRMQQLKMPPPHSVRIGHPVTREPLAEILGFTNVQDSVGDIAHKINAGTFRQAAEEVASKSLHQRLRVGKEELLNRRHASR